MAGSSTLTRARQPGAAETDTSLPCLTGKRTVDVDTLGGRPTVVNLWASWCAVCYREMPAFEFAYRASDGQVQFVGVDTLDETGPAADLLQQTGVAVRPAGRTAEVHPHPRPPAHPAARPGGP